MRRTLLATALFVLVVPLVALADDNPVLTVPADLTVQAQNPAGATVTYAASAVDSHGRPIAITCNPASGAHFGFGTTTVTCTASADGRTATKRFQVTVVDTLPPAITVPPPESVTTTSRSGKVVAFSASASDLVDGPVAVTCAPASGSRFVVGTTTVTCSAADRRANASSAVFAIRVVFKARPKTMLSPRAGATVSTPPMLRWRPVRKARFFNVQLYRRGHKMLSVWPSRSRFRLHARWRFHGREYRLRPGNYSWLVWPAYGTKASPRYGKVLGQSTFAVAR